MREVITLALVLCPWELPMPKKVSPEWFNALVFVSDWLDLTTDGELWRRSEYELEFRWVRYYARRVVTLPPSADVARFPNAQNAQAVLDFQAKYLEWNAARQALYPDCQGRDRERELDKRRWAWEALRDAHKTKRPADRRQALGWLRSTIGVESYYQGTMPLSIPEEWFWTRD